MPSHLFPVCYFPKSLGNGSFLNVNIVVKGFKGLSLNICPYGAIKRIRIWADGSQKSSGQNLGPVGCWQGCSILMKKDILMCADDDWNPWLQVVLQKVNTGFSVDINICLDENWKHWTKPIQTTLFQRVFGDKLELYGLTNILNLT